MISDAGTIDSFSNLGFNEELDMHKGFNEELDMHKGKNLWCV